jgi:prepilin-type N-terminal cleavage/methylation domain-containing protein
MQTTHPSPGRPASRGSRGIRPGFTLVELLVVVGIIALLIGLLLPALGKVVQRAKSTQTLGTMQNFAKACDAYFQEFGEYPAAVPDSVLYRGTGQDAQLPRITAMENALLALMGGYRTKTGQDADQDYDNFGAGVDAALVIEIVFPGTAGGEPDFRLKVVKTRIGEGPYRNGKQFSAFLAPRAREFGEALGQLDPDTGLPETDFTDALPELIDAWGAPIAFVKQQRGIGPLVPRPPGDPRGRFERDGLRAYVESTSLGETGMDQREALQLGVLNTQAVLNGSVGGSSARDLTLGQLIRHPGLGIHLTTATSDAERIYSGSPKGKYFVFSAGPDGVFFSRRELGLAGTVTATDIVSGAANPDGPRVVEKFDDILVSGGS